MHNQHRRGRLLAASAAALLSLFVATPTPAATPLNFYGPQCSTCQTPVLQPDGSYNLTCNNAANAGINNVAMPNAAAGTISVNGMAVTCSTNAAPASFPCGTTPANAASQNWLAAANNNGTLGSASCNLPLKTVVQAKLDSGISPFDILAQDPANLSALLGATYLGGIIIDIDSTGRGLLAAPGDVSGQMFPVRDNQGFWQNMGGGSSYKTTGATATGLYQGAGNTTTIIQAMGAPARQNYGVFNYVGWAAQLANQEYLLGFNDWYVPTALEMQAAVQYAIGINSATCQSTISGSSGNYWTSSEYSQIYAWTVNCIDNSSSSNQPNNIKNNAYNVRLVRQFTKTAISVVTSPAAVNGTNLLLTGSVTVTNGNVSAIGVCYNTVQLPGRSDYCIPVPTATSGPVSVSIPVASLLPGTLYYFRTYATTPTNGTLYGSTLTWAAPGTAPAAMSARERMNNGESPFAVYLSNPETRKDLLGGTWLDAILIDLDVANSRGLLAAAGDQPRSYSWVNSPPGYVVTNATSAKLYTGANNTLLINQKQGQPGWRAMYYAAWQAKLANEANNQSGYLNYRNWYLPTIDEARALVSYGMNGGCSGGSQQYWTSTETDFNHAATINCISGAITANSSNALKAVPYQVRLVRPFTPNTPSLSTQPPSLGGGTVSASGQITNLNGATVTAGGFCYGSQQYPTLPAGTCVAGTVNGTQVTGQFPYTGLTRGADYFVRVYTITDQGNVYGPPVRFTVPDAANCQTGINHTYTSITSPVVMAVNSTANRLYVYSGGDYTLKVVNADTRSVIGSLSGPFNSLAVAVDEARGILYYSSGMSGYIYAADAVSGKLLATAQVPNPQLFSRLHLSLDDSTGALYVGDQQAQYVYRYTYANNALSLQQQGYVSEQISALAYNPVNQYLYVAHTQKFPKPAPTFLSVFNQQLTAQPAIQDVKVPYAMQYSKTNNQLYVLNNANVLIITGNNNQIAKAVAMSPVASTLYFSESNQRAYVGLNGHKSVWLVDIDPAVPGNSRVNGAINVGDGTKYVVANPAANILYAITTESSVLSTLGGINNQVRGTLTLPAQPNTLKVNKTTGLIYVGSRTGNAIYELSCQ